MSTGVWFLPKMSCECVPKSDGPRLHRHPCLVQGPRTPSYGEGDGGKAAEGSPGEGLMRPWSRRTAPAPPRPAR
jgi:hypothetical protein